MGYADMVLRAITDKPPAPENREKPFRNLINPTQGKPGDRWRVGSLFYTLLNVIPWDWKRETDLTESEKQKIWNDFLTTAGGLERAKRIFPEFVIRLYSDRFNATQNRLRAVCFLSERLQIPLTGESLLEGYKSLLSRLEVIEEHLKKPGAGNQEEWSLEKESTLTSIECYRKYQNNQKREELKCR